MEIPKVDSLHKILFVLFVIFIIFLIISIVFKKDITPKEEQFHNKDKLVLCHATWCPHCTSFVPKWQQFKKSNRFPIQVVDLESDRDKEEIKEYKVQGYPTVILVKDGKHIEYDDERSEEGLTRFLGKYYK
jgi:thioredoxin 1